MGSREQQYGGLDGFRIVAAILVIAIHTSPLLSYSELADFTFTRILARVAVPFFFMCTGFFMLPRIGPDTRKNREVLWPFLWKVGTLYLFSIALYIPVNVYAGYFANGFSVLSFLKDLVFNGTLYHLWYFPGIMLGGWISCQLYARLSAKKAFVVAGMLYAIGLFGDSYYGIAQMSPVVDSIYQSMFHLFDYTRNGIFFAPVFIVMGGVIAASRGSEKLVRRGDNESIRHGGNVSHGDNESISNNGRVRRAKNNVRRDRHRILAFASGFVMCLCLLAAEALLLHASHLQRHDSMYLFLLPCMYFLFQLLLCVRGRSMPAVRKLCLYVYIIHPLCIVLIRAAGKVTGLSSMIVENSLIHFVLVTALAFAVSAMWLALAKRNRDKPKPTGRAWAEIHLPNLLHNLRECQRVLPVRSEVMAVVKAQAYGHGGWQIAQALSQAGIKRFAVATMEEGIELRKKGVKGEILILGYTHESNVRQLARYKLTQTVVDAEYAETLNACRVRVQVQIKIDTGMGRLGESYANIDRIVSMYRCPYLQVGGTFTHLCVADRLEKTDVAYTESQIAHFHEVIEYLRAQGIDPGKLHVQSSYGMLNYSGLHYDYARIGIALYGMLSSADDTVMTGVELRPVLSLKARVAHVKQADKGSTVGYGRSYTVERDSKIAIISIGYADGIPRMLSQAGASCLIRGSRAPLIGSVCMDQLMVDVTHIADVGQGDVATLIGSDQDECITATTLAKQCGTITNELVSRIGERVKRVYIRE